MIGTCRSCPGCGSEGLSPDSSACVGQETLFFPERLARGVVQELELLGGQGFPTGHLLDDLSHLLYPIAILLPSRGG